MLARPDPATFQVLPELDGSTPDSARMFCDIQMPDGSPSWADPRYVLRRALSKAAESGFTFYTHPEIEFFLLKNRPTDGSEPEPIDTGGYFDMTSHDTAHNFRRAAVGALESLGISVEFSHHEVAPGQQEIDLRYADALSMADNIMTFRHVIKEVAIAHRAHATFMPKPFRHQPGQRHAHPPVAVRGRPQRLPRPADELNLSKTARSFIAGLLTHAREITAVTNQWVNSYKRLWGFGAPGRARRGADLRLLGARQPLGAGPGADVQAGQGELDPGRDALARLGVQPLPGLRGAPGRRA